MKRFKSLFFVVVLCLFMIPFCASAVEYSVCKHNCNYDDLDELLDDVENIDDQPVYIDFQDSSEYIIKDHSLDIDIYLESTNGSNINISGVSENTKISLYNIFVYDDNNLVKFKNLTINGKDDNCDREYLGMCTPLYIATNSMFENVTVNSEFSGLGLLKGYTHTINGFTFNGPNYGIVVMGEDNTPFPNRSININNAKLGNCACSLALYDMQVSGNRDPEPIGPQKRSADSVQSYAVKVDSSEVNCAKYGATNVSLASNPVIYFTSTNKWTKSITKGTLFNSNANVVEEFNSRVVIDLAKKKKITLKSRVALQNYFDELKDVNPEDISWKVANSSILKVVDGKVIPLKVGSTDVTATYDNINYTLNFRVTSVKSATNNPNTGLNAFLIIAIVVAGCALIYPVALSSKTQKA